MQMKEIPLGSDLRQLAGLGTPLFPAAVYYSDLDKFVTGEVPWHWHQEVEFALSARGVLDVGLEDGVLHLGMGEGLFINSDILHCMRRGSDEPSEYLTVAFDPSLIAGAPGSLIEQQYVLPIIQRKGPDILKLDPDVGWQRDVLTLLSKSYGISEEKHFGYELELRALFTRVWHHLVLNMRGILEEKKPDAGSDRLMKMLAFMHAQYGHAPTLQEIADSAQISTSECCRVFKNKLGQTPFQYLLEFRVRVAAQLLEQTDMPITEVCYEVGFNNTSYFGKVFRQATGSSPREYRRAHSPAQ